MTPAAGFPLTVTLPLILAVASFCVLVCPWTQSAVPRTKRTQSAWRIEESIVSFAFQLSGANHTADQGFVYSSFYRRGYNPGHALLS